jgi:phosphoglycerate dehydrogenase-like enzyme
MTATGGSSRSMDKRQVVVPFKPTAEQRAMLFQVLGSCAKLVFLNELSPSERERALGEATAMLSWNFPREILPEEHSLLEHVRFVQLVSAGADHVPLEDLPARLVVASNAGAYAAPMAEHVMAMTLALAKRLLMGHQKLRGGDFDQLTPNRSLSGMTAGILGFGGIGRATARLMRAFGMKIRAINRTGASSEGVDFVGTLRDLERVLRSSDVVVVSLPLTKATRGLIGSGELGWMKPDAILVNVARGAIIDEEALYHHAKTHPAFMVGIDAWWTEPFLHGMFRMGHPFLELPNVLGSPHNSAMVPGAILEGIRQAAENIRRFLQGEKVRGIVRPEDAR